MSKEFEIQKDVLYKLYYGDKLSYSQISKIVGCSVQTLLKKMRKFDFKARHKVFNISKEDLYDLYYNKRMSFSEMQKVTGFSMVTLLKKFRVMGIKSRSVSESLKGREIWWKDKIGKSNLGKKRPGIGGRKKGCLPWNTGLTKARNPNLIRYGCSGKNHWNWKGGISLLEVRIRQTSEYKKWRFDIFCRDEWKCKVCGEHSGKLNAHHIVSFLRIILDNNIKSIEEAVKCSFLWNLGNGVTLCKKCHNAAHHKGEENEKGNNPQRRIISCAS